MFIPVIREGCHVYFGYTGGVRCLFRLYGRGVMFIPVVREGCDVYSGCT